MSRVEHDWISILEGHFWLLHGEWIRNGVPQGQKPARRLAAAWSKDWETKGWAGGGMWLENFTSVFFFETWGDFPSGPMVKNLPSNAEDMGLIPAQGTKIPCAAEPLSPHITTEKPACCSC